MVYYGLKQLCWPSTERTLPILTVSLKFEVLCCHAAVILQISNATFAEEFVRITIALLHQLFFLYHPEAEQQQQQLQLLRIALTLQST